MYVNDFVILKNWVNDIFSLFSIGILIICPSLPTFKISSLFKENFRGLQTISDVAEQVEHLIHAREVLSSNPGQPHDEIGFIDVWVRPLNNFPWKEDIEEIMKSDCWKNFALNYTLRYKVTFGDWGGGVKTKYNRVIVLIGVSTTVIGRLISRVCVSG